MGMLDKVQGISKENYIKLTGIFGFPGSGKTTLAGTYPKPILYVSIGNDGGGVVLSKYSDDDVKSIHLDTDDKDWSIHKVFNLLKELRETEKLPYKTVVFDTWTSIEEDVITQMEKEKGSKLNLADRGTVGSMMLHLRDDLVKNAMMKNSPEYVFLGHIKTKEIVDGITGETTVKYIPKMSYNNGTVLMEKASNIMLCDRKAVVNSDGTKEVKFVTYIGANPNVDTKLRISDKDLLKTGVYVEDCTYEKIEKIKNGGKTEKINFVELTNNEESVSNNPFEKKGDNEW